MIGNLVVIQISMKEGLQRPLQENQENYKRAR
jgi:hypothetical protein